MGAIQRLNEGEGQTMSHASRRGSVGVLVAAMVVAAAGAWAAASSGKATGRGEDEGRIGLGVNLGRADVRYEMNPEMAIDGFLGLDTESGGGLSNTGITVGGYFLGRITKPDPVSFLWVAGLAYDSQSVSTTITVPVLGSVTSKTSQGTFSIQGGVGAEYFFPGTKQFSIEARVGLSIDFISDSVDTGGTSSSVSSTGFGLKDLTGGIFMLRYYFGNGA